MASIRTPHYRSVIAFLRRNALLIAGVGLLVTFWMLVYTFAVYRPSFAAKSVVIIKDSAITSRYIMPEQYYAMQTTSSSSSNPVLNTMGILKSGAISDALYEYFRTKRPDQLKKNKIETKADWEKFFLDGSGFIKAKNQPGTDLIAIQFSWSDPQIAKEALDVVVKAFQDASRDLNKQEQISRTKFLASQLGEIEEQLATIRREKTEYQSKMGTVSVGREGSDLAGTRMELANKLNQMQAAIQGKENLVRRYQTMLGMNPEKAMKASALGQNASLARMQDELYRLQQQYAQLNSQLTETNPKVLEVKAQIEQVKANIEAEKTRTRTTSEDGVVADPTRNALVSSMLAAQAEAQDLRAQAAVISGRLAQINGQIRNFPEIAEGLANIEQKEAALSTALDNLRQKVMEGRLKEEQTLSNVFIVDAPRLPDKAQFPARNHLIALSLMLGLSAGLAVAFGKEQLLSDTDYGMPEWLEPVADPEPATPSSAPAPAYAATAPEPPQSRPAQPQPVPAPVLTVPEPDRKVEIPAVGSLFDALLPVAGPIVNQQQAGFRRDLTQPLPKTDSRQSAPIQIASGGNQPVPIHPLNSQGNGSNAQVQVPDRHSKPQAPAPTRDSLKPLDPVHAVIQPARIQPAAPPRAAAQSARTVPPLDPVVANQRLQDADLLPPPSTVPAPPKPAMPQAQKQLPPRRPVQPIQVKTQDPNTQGIPVMHSLPQPAEQTASAPTPATPQTHPSAQAGMPQPKAPPSPISPPAVQVIPPISQPAPAPGQSLPFGRRSRSLPAFLLEEEEKEKAEPPRKTLLAPEENLMADVDPIGPPPGIAPREATIAQGEPVTVHREPLGISRWFFRKNPDRHPEVYFPMGPRGSKPDMPGSLNRIMQTLESETLR